MSLPHWLAAVALSFVLTVGLTGCASDIKLGVATNEAPRAPEEPPR